MYTIHLDICSSLFTHTDLHSQSICIFLNCLRLQITVRWSAMLLAVFWQRKHAKSISTTKIRNQKNTDHIYFTLAWRCSFTIHELHLQKKTVKCCKSIFLLLKHDLHLYKTSLAHFAHNLAIFCRGEWGTTYL